MSNRLPLSQPEATTLPGVLHARATARPWSKSLMHALRRGHLYLGLFLFPWAILYGVTAFLFNHPTVLSDQRATHFDANSYRGTALADRATIDEQALEIVAKLNEFQHPSTPYQIRGAARYSREFAFGNAITPEGTINFLFNPKTGDGTIRLNSSVPKQEPKVRAPFDTTEKPLSAISSSMPKIETVPRAFFLDQSLNQQLKLSMPSVLAHHGFAAGDIKITSVPDIIVPIEAEGQLWQATYNPLTGHVQGVLLNQLSETKQELSVRRFLLRLHTAHGYPSETNAKWFWAIIVDVMAIVLCFWGITGLFMWRQIKATRKLGVIVLLLSGLSATALAYGMHELMTQ